MIVKLYLRYFRFKTRCMIHIISCDTCHDLSRLFLLALLLWGSQSSERWDCVPKTIPLDVWFSQRASEPPGCSTRQYFSWQKQSVLDQPRITRIRRTWNDWNVLLHTPPCVSASLHDTTPPDPVVKPTVRPRIEGQPPSALCHTESKRVLVSRLLSHMRLLVFHSGFVFLIRLPSRLSRRTLRCVPALKCD